MSTPTYTEKRWEKFLKMSQGRNILSYFCLIMNYISFRMTKTGTIYENSLLLIAKKYGFSEQEHRRFFKKMKKSFDKDQLKYGVIVLSEDPKEECKQEVNGEVIEFKESIEVKEVKRKINKKKVTKHSPQTKKPKTSPPTNPPSSEGTLFAEDLVTQILSLHPNKKPSDFNKSKIGHDFDKLVRISKLPIAEVQKAFKWAWEDPFWNDKALSAETMLIKSKSNGLRKIENLFSAFKKSGNNGRGNKRLPTKEERKKESELAAKNGYWV